MTDATVRNAIWKWYSFVGLLAFVAAVPIISIEDPGGLWLRVGMILITVGAAFWLPLPAVIGVAVAAWLGPNLLQYQIEDRAVFEPATWMELPGVIGLAVFGVLTRRQLRLMEEEADAIHGHYGLKAEMDDETGVYQERLLKESIERELVRSRRFGRHFALMLTGIDHMRLKFDYRDEEKWSDGLKATGGVLLNTRAHIDRVYRYGDRGFALLLPETGPKEITGLVRRLARTAKRAEPAEGEPGGPLPLHFGATFFPQCATTVDDLMRRAEVALRLAEKNPSRVQLDGAEAPDLPSPELLRKEDEEEAHFDALAGKWLGAEAPEEEEAPGVWLTRPSVSEEPAPALVDLPATEEPRETYMPAISAESAPTDVHDAWETAEEPGPVESEAVATAPQPALGREETVAVPVASTEDAAPDAETRAPPRKQADDSVTKLLARLDETLAVIRSMKSESRS